MLPPLAILLLPLLVPDVRAVDLGLQEGLSVQPARLVVRVPLSALRPAPPVPELPPRAVIISSRAVSLQPGAETLLSLQLVLDVLVAGPVDLPIVGSDLALSSATLDGRPVALPGTQGGWRSLVTRLPVGRHELVLMGSVSTPRPQLRLPLVRAVRGRVAVTGPWEVAVQGGVSGQDGSFSLLGDELLDVVWTAPTAPTAKSQVTRAQAVTALRVDASGVTARSIVRVTVLHQPTQLVELRLPPVDDLEITGPAVRSFERSGQLIRVHLSRPIQGRIDLSLSYRAGPPAAAGSPAPLPMPVTTSGQLDAGFVSVLSGDQGTVIPVVRRGLNAVPSGQLPDWGRGLVQGQTVTTLALTSAQSALDLRVLDLSPVEAPATLVDQARYEVAYTQHGRALLRCRYQVRNDRGQYLGLSLPPGARAFGVRVAGTVVQTVRDGTRLYIPLEKSVETLTGLVTFPVELSLLVDEAAWRQRGERTLQVPAVDAPVAEARWEIILPPGARSRKVEGAPTVVDSWTQGGPSLTIDHAVAVGGESLADQDKEELRREQSQDAWNQAYRAYKDNDFDASRELLDTSLVLDANNRAAQDLLGNVGVLLGGLSLDGASVDGKSGADDDQTRRVRALARAKTQGLSGKQDQQKRKAQASLRAGDYEAAYAELSELSSLTEQLAMVEDSENVDQKVMLADTRQQLVEVEEKLAQEKSRREDRQSAPWESISAVEIASPTDSPEVDEDWVEDYSVDDYSVEDGNLAIVLRGDTAGPAGQAAQQADADKTVSLMLEDLVTQPSAGYGSGVISSSGEMSGEALTGDGLSGEALTGEALTGEALTGEALTGSLGGVGLAEPVEEMVAMEPTPDTAKVQLSSESRGPRSHSSAPRRSRSAKKSMAPAAPPTTGAPALGPQSQPRPTAAPKPAQKPAPQPQLPGTVPTAMSMDPAVTAAPMSVRPPRAGDRLLLQQQLLAPGDALSVTLSYRLAQSSPSRSQP